MIPFIYEVLSNVFLLALSPKYSASLTHSLSVSFSQTVLRTADLRDGDKNPLEDSPQKSMRR